MLSTGERLGRITELFVEPARAIGVGEGIADELLRFAADHDCIGVDALALPGHRATKNFFEEQGFTGAHARHVPVAAPRRMTSPILAVGAVAVVDDRLLLIRRGHGPAAGEWSVPGGHVEAGEPVEAAVVREVAEETGLQVVVDELLGWVERFDDDRALRHPRLPGHRPRPRHAVARRRRRGPRRRGCPPPRSASAAPSTGSTTSSRMAASSTRPAPHSSSTMRHRPNDHDEHGGDASRTGQPTTDTRDRRKRLTSCTASSRVGTDAMARGSSGSWCHSPVRTRTAARPAATAPATSLLGRSPM